MRGLIVIIIYLHYLISKNSSYEFLSVNSSLSREVRQTKFGCLIPNHPKFGEWSVYKTTATNPLKPGDVAPVDTILLVECKSSYKLVGDATLICIRGKWTTLIGECILTCPSRFSTSLMKVTCSYEGRTLENCEQPLDGTRAHFECADFYEDKSLEINPVHVCFNGKWNQNLPECVPICGLKTGKQEPTLIVGGKNASKTEYPWQVGLYNNTDKDLICGGSLITPRIVLTAAHCITNDKGKMLPKTIFIIAVGKYYRKYNDERDTYAQFSSIHTMFTPRQYRGEIQNYFGDIALLVTKTTFVLSPKVQPVCIDWGLLKYRYLLDPSRTVNAIVTGWGFTVEHKSLSEVLKELEVPLIQDEKCLEKIPEDFEQFITDDKMCAGFTDAGVTVCRGDSGGGLMAKYKNRYYIVAVVSLAPQAATLEGGCDSNQYSLYTRVPYHIDFLIDKTARIQANEVDQCELDCDSTISTTTTTTTTTTEQPTSTVSLGKCTLPDHAKNGNWTIFGFSEMLSPGMEVTSGTIVSLSCPKGFLRHGTQLIYCNKGEWSEEIGSCLKECPPLSRTESTLTICSFNKTQLRDCLRPFDGVIANYKCAPYYENKELDKNPVRVCIDGKWDRSAPECVPTCGTRATPNLLIVNGNFAKKEDFPWHVGIYRGGEKEYICGGTLISPKLVVTAAHCVTKFTGELEPIENYFVAAGKLHVDYNDTSDINAQFSQLKQIFVPVEYSGIVRNFYGNIAVLDLKNPFKISSYIQPVCVDWTTNSTDTDNLQNVTGLVPGWGFTQASSNLSLTLRQLQVPIISYDDCVATLPRSFISFVTPDQICAGYSNKSRGVCLGDSGGGLVTKRFGRYFIIGVVSVAPRGVEGGCSIDDYALYTKISYYTSFLLEKEAQVKSSRNDSESESCDDCQTTTTAKPVIPNRSFCVLPQHPASGKWSLLSSNTSFLPGDSVPEGMVLNVTCSSNYELNGNSVILCNKGEWSSQIGRCEKLCSPALSTSKRKATCIQNNKNLENCTKPIDGTSVKYECIPFYESFGSPIRNCKDGSWDYPAPQCVPVCGKKALNPQVLIANGVKATSSDYPWHVALYKDKKGEMDYICSGAIINKNLIITSAICVTDHDGIPLSKDLFTIIAGKYYREFNDSRDNSPVLQQRKLKEILIHPGYKGPVTVYNKNVAILVTEKSLEFSTNVRPVCIDWESNFYNSVFANNNRTGFVTGWGYTDRQSTLANELQELKVPIVNSRTCALELPTEAFRLLTKNRFCAGYLNQSKNVCAGDSGGPLVVKNDADGKYYLTGIVDVSAVPSGGGCDVNNYALYSRISTFLDDFIKPLYDRFNK